MKKLKELSIRTKGLILAVVFSGIALLNSSYVDNYFEITKNLDIFVTLFKELNLYYVDETKPGDLMKTGIEGMLESLDPYTNYIPESDIEDFRFMQTGQYGGIGALIRTMDKKIVIAEPYEDSPAQKAGLEAGDVIIEVNGKSTEGKNTEDISKILKGQPNTEVKLVLKREGVDKPIEKTIMREEIKVKSVPHFEMLNNEVGYIKLNQFTDKCTEEVQTAFKELKEKKGMKALVLDLRGNPGGLLNEAVSLSNLFVEKGQLVVSTKGKVKEWEKTYKAANQALDMEIPLVVLVNSGSASASEIVSGTIQDLDRGVIVGQRSYGKGLVQTTRPLSYNTQLKVTTAKYYIPSGRCIQALDYSHRNEDGSVGKVPDSLMKKFATKNGRPVFDGGGVLPDIVLEPVTYSQIARALMGKNMIFNFATKYKREHPTIPAVKEFQITDELFKEFTDYIADKDYEYSTHSEDVVKKFKETAEKEKYFKDVEAEYEALKAKLSHNKNEDLVTFKDEIKELLKEEIVSRYYYQKGRVESLLDRDPDVKEALSILADKSKYSSLLAGPVKGK
ncbi:MAG: S41 family peptidase [Bacteroidia bacterium]